MNKGMLAALATCSVIASSPAIAATSIDFRSLPSGTPVTNQYAGVTFSLTGGAASGNPQIAYYSDGTYGGLSNTPTAGFYPTAERLVASFTNPVSGVKFSFDNEGYNGFNYYAALDRFGNVLATGALDQLDPSYVVDLSGTPGISKIFWDNGYNDTGSDWTQALGTLSFAAAVPEPATWVMMIAGFGLVGAGMRRKGRVTVRFA